jgi:hypothetical protein
VHTLSEEELVSENTDKSLHDLEGDPELASKRISLCNLSENVLYSCSPSPDRAGDEEREGYQERHDIERLEEEFDESPRLLKEFGGDLLPRTSGEICSPEDNVGKNMEEDKEIRGNVESSVDDDKVNRNTSSLDKDFRAARGSVKEEDNAFESEQAKPDTTFPTLLIRPEITLESDLLEGASPHSCQVPMSLEFHDILINR